MTGFEALQQLRLPDAWQADAIRALAAGDDVIVQAPTGARTHFERAGASRERGGDRLWPPSTLVHLLKWKML